MRTAKVTCKCGKQLCYIEEFLEQGDFQEREFELLTEQGYTVTIGENLPKSDPCLEPCFEREDCAFAKQFSTLPGFKRVYNWKPKNFSETFSGKICVRSTVDSSETYVQKTEN